ncbi:lytic transglycosylase domain-containing protein [Mesorhizobium sp. M5C.F.Ca.IN.020.32.2.1]|uniref:lytic transglycosylase domain-containing protein n=1 Tax=Mesorhizobium sp. M5C.F.Ca.IN.020.32.2.1 TaxID=2496771 RepID=UPI000FD2C271|nr:lytic transglycosylase domain-containing protein [Mesorhizobium sp. M5C.F.Ca.IN.020.32.2.1]RUV29244.1 lytic transglycosylase domain-containing protein [Mesorhizobium sp. M5C.F.Ca.IN.020.32.2.1]
MPRHRITHALRRRGICCRVAILLLCGVALLAPGSPALAQSTSADRLAIDRRFAPYIAEASKRFRVPERWIRAVLEAESAHDVRAVSSAGAMGLMQVMPGTWEELRARHSLGDDPFDPRDNILAGTAYLREMLDRYGKISAMLAAYNAGPSRYDAYLSTGRPLPAETRDYVARLAPILGGKPLPGRPPKTPRRTDWREAPLFVVPAGAGTPAGPKQADGQSDAETTVHPVHGDDTASLPRDGIFAARFGEGLAP